MLVGIFVNVSRIVICFRATKASYSFLLSFLVYDSEPWFYADITRQECEEMLKQVIHIFKILFVMFTGDSRLMTYSQTTTTTATFFFCTFD